MKTNLCLMLAAVLAVLLQCCAPREDQSTDVSTPTETTGQYETEETLPSEGLEIPETENTDPSEEELETTLPDEETETNPPQGDEAVDPAPEETEPDTTESEDGEWGSVGEDD